MPIIFAQDECFNQKLESLIEIIYFFQNPNQLVMIYNKGFNDNSSLVV